MHKAVNRKDWKKKQEKFKWNDKQIRKPIQIKNNFWTSKCHKAQTRPADEPVLSINI